MITQTEYFTPIKERWRSKLELSPERVKRIVAAHFNIDVSAFHKIPQNQDIFLCRYFVYKILYKHTRRTQEQIGEYFGRDRTTIVNGITRLTGWMDIYPEIREHFETIEKIVLENERYKD